jgi:hypothetical protein
LSQYLDFKKEIDFQGKPLEQILFDDFLPSVTGHAKLLDKYHADIRSKWHLTVTKNNYKYHDEEESDPDWIVKQCPLFLLQLTNVT